MDAIICDTSSLIRFFKLQKLALIALAFERVYIPVAVYEECDANLKKSLDAHRFISISAKKDQVGKYGHGEREMLNIAIETGIPNILTDDSKAIREALRLGLTPYTTLAVLVDAKLAGLITSVREQIETLQAAGEVLSSSAINDALMHSGE